MTGIIKLEIVESPQELLVQLKQPENQAVKEKIQTLYWLKTRQVESTGAIATLLGKHRTTISRWLSEYRQGGLSCLLSRKKSPGRPRKIPETLEKKLQQELQDPEGFTSYKEVQKWLKAVEGIDMSYTGVHHAVRYRLQSQLKVPRPVHTKQNPLETEEFKKNSRRK